MDKTAVNGDELNKLNAALTARQTAIQVAAEKAALMTAAAAVDITGLTDQAAIDAAQAAIDALQAALDVAANVSGADKAAYVTQLAAANAAVSAAQTALDAAGQKETLIAAAAAVDISALNTAQAVTDAQAAIAALQNTLDAATDVSDADKATYVTQVTNANAAVQTAQTALNTAQAADKQKADLMTAAGNVDTTGLISEAAIKTAKAAIKALEDAIAAAADVSAAAKATYLTQVTNANAAVTTAQNRLDQLAGLMTAAAAVDASDLATIEALEAAIAAATDVSAEDKKTYVTQANNANANNQRGVINAAIKAAQTAVGVVDNDSSDAEVAKVDAAVAAAKAAVAAAANVPAAEKTAFEGTVTAVAGQLDTAKTARTAAMDDAAKDATVAMVAKAKALYTALATVDTSAVDLTDAGKITVGTNELSEDKKTTVGALSGWEGKKYALEVASGANEGDTYEAVVYSNIGDPTEGAKFSATYPYDAKFVNGSLDTSDPTNPDELEVSTTDAAVQARVDSPRFDQSAGKKEFELPNNQSRVLISGSYNGISGTYYCKPADNETCSASVAADGFTLDNGDWSFKANDVDDRLMDQPDANYAVYGWWLQEDAEDGSYDVNAFHLFEGTAPNDEAVNITGLNGGTATYNGKAVGQYAIKSAVDGENDAGGFTADAELEAKFGGGDNSKITGTIDKFTGADGKSRNWSVELKEGAITGSSGVISAVTNGTVWTIGDTETTAAGSWSGELRTQGSDGVPAVATGVFNSTYTEDGDFGATTGHMVGAFGANR